MTRSKVKPTGPLRRRPPHAPCSIPGCPSESTGVMHVELWDETTDTTSTAERPMCHRCSARWWGAGEWRGYLDGSSKMWGAKGRGPFTPGEEQDPDDAG